MWRMARKGFGMAVAAMAMLCALTSTAAQARAEAPELPRSHVDTTLVPPSGSTILVRSGGDLKAALEAAQPGDVVALEAGATFTGPFTLPAKPGNAWITVRASVADDRLPPPGRRIDPSY